MSRILATAFLLLTALSAAAAAVCVRGECVGSCTGAVCTATAAVAPEDASVACCALVVAGQSSVAPARTPDHASANSPGDEPGAANADHVAPERLIAPHFEKVAGAVSIVQAGQTIYLRTGRLRL